MRRRAPLETIKQMTAANCLLTRGLGKVKTEAALSVLAYNILRTINLVGASVLKTKFT